MYSHYTVQHSSVFLLYFVPCVKIGGKIDSFLNSNIIVGLPLVSVLSEVMAAEGAILRMNKICNSVAFPSQELFFLTRLRYCACFIGDSWDGLVLASGTVFGQVVMWRPASSDVTDDARRCRPVLHRLCGHEAWLKAFS